MSTPKKIVKTRIVKDQSARIVEDTKGDPHIVILEQRTYFSFTNQRAGMCFFKREDGKEDFFQGKETKTDISEREREMLFNTRDFREGWITEEKTEEISEENIINKHGLSDSRLETLIKNHKNDSSYLKNFIAEMSSDFALKRMKNNLQRLEMPSSLIMVCDVRLKELEEAYLETKKAPIMK